jgi:hypothetical protein
MTKHQNAELAVEHSLKGAYGSPQLREWGSLRELTNSGNGLLDDSLTLTASDPTGLLAPDLQGQPPSSFGAPGH